MLTKDDLLTCCEAPNINDVSLELYRNFSETYLIPRKFHYEFLDGSVMNLEFTEWGIYHMLSILDDKGIVVEERCYNFDIKKV